MKTVRAGSIIFSNSRPLNFIAGPCVIESEKACRQTAAGLKRIFADIGKKFVFKASFDKANRTSLHSFRGPGIEEGLRIIARIRQELRIPVLVDVHETWQAAPAAKAADILQVPAFLCRQTDLLKACADTGRTINVKKGQFLSPWDMQNIVVKLESRGNRSILLTERGSSFGYGNLVADMRSLEIMKETGYPVIFDCTHSVQKPGGLGNATGGDSKFSLPLAKAAAALKIAGIFFETHPNPAKALSDAANSIALRDAPKFVRTLSGLDAFIKREGKG